MSTPFKVMIVDDSTVFRSQLRAALTGIPGLEVASFATNGRMAIDLLKVQQVDLIVLDLEMPEMDGMETLREIKKLGLKTRIIVFSAHTKKAADTAISALSLGASDIVTKPTGDATSGTPAELIRKELRSKIEQFMTPSSQMSATARLAAVGLGSADKSLASQASGLAALIASANAAPAGAATGAASTIPVYPRNLNLSQGLWTPKVVVVASSTGGPAALERFFSQLQGPLKAPMLIVQHMPPVFTAVLAERLAKISGLPVREAKHGELVELGHVYVAPGDYHMKIVKTADGRATIALNQEAQRNSVRPAADHLFESAAGCYGGGTLGIVFTGMGSDGADGAVAIKMGSGSILIQERESCVVFGMPGAVAERDAHDKALTIENIAQQLSEIRFCTLKKLAS